MDTLTPFMQKHLLRILRCPITKRPLKEVSSAITKTVNRRIRQNDLYHQDGSRVEKLINIALITDDGSYLYRIEQGIVILLPSQI